MPQRQNRVRIDSEAVQGEGSFVVLRRLTVGEIKHVRKSAEDSFELTEEMVRDHIVEWNWADEEGNPLPQPAKDPTVFESVTDEELSWLAKAIAGVAESRKN